MGRSGQAKEGNAASVYGYYAVLRPIVNVDSNMKHSHICRFLVVFFEC